VAISPVIRAARRDHRVDVRSDLLPDVLPDLRNGTVGLKKTVDADMVLPRSVLQIATGMEAKTSHDLAPVMKGSTAHDQILSRPGYRVG
jgi:hypothetical protein